MIPLFGQGTPLPADFPYQGQWMIENFMFLYRSDSARSPEGIAPRFAVGALNYEGKLCFGFDSAQLAAALGIGVDEVFNANRDGTLTACRRR
jgi:hypothetical protein